MNDTETLKQLINLIRERHKELLSHADYLKDWETRKAPSFHTKEDRACNGALYRGFCANAKWIKDTFRWLDIDL